MALRRKHREAEVSTDSLNDIMFFLLLFFLILSTMVSPNAIKVNLPDSKIEKPDVIPPKPIHVGVNEKHQYFIDQDEVNVADLEKMLDAKLKAVKAKTNEFPPVVLHIDKTLQYQDFVDVLQIGNKLNCKMVLATKASNQ